MASHDRINADPEYFDEEKSQRFLAKLKRVLSKVPFARTALAMYFAFLDPAVPLATKGTIAGALLYFLSPIDLIPDILVGVGFLDDAAVIGAAFKAVQGMIQPRHYDQAEEWLRDAGHISEG